MNQKFEAFLSELADFSNLKQNRQSISIQQKPILKNVQFNDQIDFNNNSKLISQFKTMRQKIKVLTKQNQQYKANFSLTYKQIQSKFIDQIMILQQKDVQNTAALNFLKKQIQQINNGIDDLKTKNSQLQRQLNQKKNIEKQLEFFQNSIVQIKQANQELKKQNDKINQISILQKIEFQEKMKHLEMMKQVDKQYVQQIQVQLNKARQKCLAAESKYRKILNEYQQTRYDRDRITQYNLKEQDLQYSINELKKQKNALKAQLTEQKEKRLKVEEKMMEKQEFSSLYSIQIQTLERQLNNLKKKNKKLIAKCEQKDTKAQKQAYKNIESKSKLYKSIQIIQEFLTRIKRQLTLPHELLQFLKSCQFKISKLKQQEQTLESASRSKSKKKRAVQKSPQKSTLKKSIQQSKSKKVSIQDQEQELSKKNEQTQSYYAPKYLNQIIKDRTPLKQSTYSEDIYENGNYHNKEESMFNKSIKSLGDDGVQKKVKRQREQKERKIRQNILYKKLEASNNQKQKYLIRQEIVKLNKDDK